LQSNITVYVVTLRILKTNVMKKFFSSLRDMLIAGLIFLLPLLILFVLLTKVFQFLTGFTTKIASFFGLKSIVGISGGTIVSAISLILFCMLCGYLVRVSSFKNISKWIDKKMMTHIPGYAVYRQMVMAKLEEKDEVLPYKSAAWIDIHDMQQPCFLMETLPDGRCVVFLPAAGNVKEGTVLMVAPAKLQLWSNADLKGFRGAIANLGLGFAKQLTPANVV